jgi:hypothetical protein
MIERKEEIDRTEAVELELREVAQRGGAVLAVAPPIQERVDVCREGERDAENRKRSGAARERFGKPRIRRATIARTKSWRKRFV